MFVNPETVCVVEFEHLPRFDEPEEMQWRADVGGGNFIVPDRRGLRQPETIQRWEVRVISRLAAWKEAEGLWKQLWYAELIRPLPYRKGERPGIERNRLSNAVAVETERTRPSGRFRRVRTGRLDGPNVLRHLPPDIRAAGEAQKRLARMAPPSRGAAVAGKKDPKKKK